MAVVADAADSEVIYLDAEFDGIDQLGGGVVEVEALALGAECESELIEVGVCGSVEDDVIARVHRGGRDGCRTEDELAGIAGIVGEIPVREGGRVKVGDLLLRLDETVTRSNLAIVINDLTAQRARLARLQAFRDGLQEPRFPADLVEAARESKTVLAVLQGEAKLSRFQQRTREEQKQQFMERIKQLREGIKGLKEQQKSLTGQLEIAQKELDDLMPLYKRGNVQRPRVTSLEREILRNRGLLGDTLARIAQSQARIAETELQIVQSDHDFITDVITQLRETETKINELKERKITAEDQLERLDIRSPITGRVHELTVHTIGGVVTPSETLMSIVPDDDRLIVEVRVSPADIDQLLPGQETRVRFTAFNRRTTDELKGTVQRIGADLTHDTQANISYYTVAISIAENELATLGNLKLVPGMPAEVFIKTGERTVASYLIKPLRDQMERAFRER